MLKHTKKEQYKLKTLARDAICTTKLQAFPDAPTVDYLNQIEFSLQYMHMAGFKGLKPPRHPARPYDAEITSRWGLSGHNPESLTVDHSGFHVLRL